MNLSGAAPKGLGGSGGRGEDQATGAVGRATAPKGPQNHARIRAVRAMLGAAAARRNSERCVSLARVWWALQDANTPRKAL